MIPPLLLTSPLSSFIQLRRSAVPSGSRGAGVRWSAAGAGRGEPHAASPAAGEGGSRLGRREGRRAVRSRGADWPWPPMCLCLCGSRCCCQHAPKVCARQPASAAHGPIAEPPRSPDSWPALAMVYFRPDVTTGADFKVGTVHLGSPLGWIFFSERSVTSATRVRGARSDATLYLPHHPTPDPESSHVGRVQQKLERKRTLAWAR